MTNIGKALARLREDHRDAQKQADKLAEAISVLEKLTRGQGGSYAGGQGRAGELQVIDRVTPDLVETLKGTRGVKVLDVPAIEAQRWIFQLGREPVKDPRLRWPDGLSFGPDGWLYVTCSSLQHVLFTTPIERRANAPYHIFRFRPGHGATPGH